MATINTLKNWFRTGSKPTQAQFWAWIDSFRHKEEAVPAADISGLQELLDGKADRELLNLKANQEDMQSLDERLTGAVAGIGTTIEGINGSIEAINLKDEAQDDAIEELNGRVDDHILSTTTGIDALQGSIEAINLKDNAQDDAIEELNGRVDDAEVRIEGLEQNSSGLVAYREYFIDIINGDDSNDGLSLAMAFKTTDVLNALLQTIAVKRVRIVLDGPVGFSDFGQLVVKSPLHLRELIVSGYYTFGATARSRIEVDIADLDAFYYEGEVTGELERIGYVSNVSPDGGSSWYATLKDVTIRGTRNFKFMYNIMNNATFDGCTVDLNTLYSYFGARFQNCVILGEESRIMQALGDCEVVDCILNSPPLAGYTDTRPDNPPIGTCYYDTDIERPIWFTGEKWVNGMGGDLTTEDTPPSEPWG